MRRVTIRQLQVFSEAAKLLSFARAAERLRLTPAAVSFQIKQLESLAGVGLFERRGRSIALADAGLALQRYADAVLQSLADADQAMTALKGAVGGLVRVGLVSTASALVPHMLARFRAAHPSVTIHLRDGNRQRILATLLGGEIDIAVIGEPPADAPVVAAPFAPHPSVIIATTGHAQAGKRGLAPAMLKGEPFLAREEGSGTRALFDRFVLASAIEPRIVMTSSSNETIKQAVIAGMGIALISRHTIGLELASGLLSVLDVAGTPLMRRWFVVHRRGMPLLPVHGRLRDFLIENGGAIIDDLAGTSRRNRARRRPV